MSNTEETATTRRGITRRLVLISGSGLIIGGLLPFGGKAQSPQQDQARTVEPHAFLRIASDNTVTVLVKHTEFGQGIYTGLATLVAEELDADWAQIRAEGAPADATVYNNLLFGPMQATGGSTSMMNAYMQMREAGAVARSLIVTAAAREWNVDATEIIVEHGIVQHKSSDKRAEFGALSAHAARLPLPDTVSLKQPRDFRLIGRNVPRLDRESKTNGEAIYTQDVQLPNMLVATLARAERPGQRLVGYDRDAAMAVPGVRHVLETEYGVAILGDHSWAAISGRVAVDAKWTDRQDRHFNSAGFQDLLLTLTEQEGGRFARSDPDAETAWNDVSRVIDLPVLTPFLAHVPMEPPNYVMQRTNDGLHVWAGEQWHTGNQMALADYFGLAPEQVRITSLYAGGSFGRRALTDPMQGFVGECAAIVKAFDGDAPVKLIYTREDDVKGRWYRPAFCDRIRAGLDDQGHLHAWEHRLAGPSIARGTPMEPFRVMPGGYDEFSVEGATTTAYALPAYRVRVQEPEVPFPVLWHRSSGYFGSILATELGLDAVARETGTDRLALRRRLLVASPRVLAALNKVVDRVDWGTTVDPVEGWMRGRGVAAGHAKNTPFAMVCDVRVNAKREFRIERFVCAVDCGVAVNLDVVRAQIESGACFGLGMTLHGEITITDGHVEQENFDGFQLLTMAEAPPVEVDILPSNEPPTGVGEIATPYVAPALINALWDATGIRPDTLPLKRAGYHAALRA